MQKTHVNLKPLKLVGITCRTNNMQEMNPDQAKIGVTVQIYFANSTASKINNRTNSGITYCVYTNYASDFTGDYTFFIGEQVDNFENLDSEQEQLTIESQDYTKFTTEAGAMPEVCISAWQKIWAMSPAELDGERRYIADFEVYDERAANPSNTVLDIYIGVKK